MHAKTTQAQPKCTQKPLKHNASQNPLKIHSKTAQHSKYTQNPLKINLIANEDPFKMNSIPTRPSPLKIHSIPTQSQLNRKPAFEIDPPPNLFTNSFMINPRP